VTLVCRAGHLVGDPYDRPGQESTPCPICGAETFSSCLGCREPIWALSSPSPPPIGTSGSPADQPAPQLPRYCHCCGRPFPWTERVLSAVRSVIREIAALDPYERDQLRRSIDHIVHETPQTRLAVLRINAALSRVGGETAASLRALIVSIASAGVIPLLQPESAPP